MRTSPYHCRKFTIFKDGFNCWWKEWCPMFGRWLTFNESHVAGWYHDAITQGPDPKPICIGMKIYLLAIRHSNLPLYKVHVHVLGGATSLGWEIHLKFLGIPRLIQFRTIWTPKFSSNFIFLIVKCVPANSEHIFSGSESTPDIYFSDFMNRKAFLPWVFFWPNMKISSGIS